MADSDRFLSLSAFGLAVLDILVNCLYCAFVFACVKHNIRFIGVRLCGSIWPRCTMPGIFVDIYFLKATILNY